MSFDVYLMAFRNGEGCAANKEAAQTLIHSFEHARKEGSAGCTVTLQDGIKFELYADELFDELRTFNSAMISADDTSEAVYGFIYDFAVASFCVAFPVMEPACILVFEHGSVQHLPIGLADKMRVVLINSKADIVALLQDGFEAWAAYREKVNEDYR